MCSVRYGETPERSSVKTYMRATCYSANCADSMTDKRKMSTDGHLLAQCIAYVSLGRA